ncbi:response regulator transcription factor [Lacipirellula sp.]|uniref:response regulator transcription factor n=1 Tax=Lacipirellula sp. TaxID=2691419 RepID=UPI003D097EE3
MSDKTSATGLLHAYASIPAAGRGEAYNERISHVTDAQERLGKVAGRQLSMAESESDATKSVLLVASSSPTRTHFRELIAKGGYRVAAVSSANEALRLLRIEVFALAVVHEVDDKTPSRLSREMKSLTDEDLRPPLPVVLLASTFDPDYAVRCLRAGSDDYITGPHLEPRVLLARLEAVLRSYRRQSTERERERKLPAHVGDIMIDPERFRVEVDGSAVEVTRIQFMLLYAMASQPDRTFTRTQLRGIVAEQGGNLDDGSIKSHIHHLRRRLGVAGRQIETVRGHGYRLVE